MNPKVTQRELNRANSLMRSGLDVPTAWKVVFAERGPTATQFAPPAPATPQPSRALPPVQPVQARKLSFADAQSSALELGQGLTLDEVRATRGVGQ